ncbi:putative phosphorylase [Wilcoxina mikolae CBS 423.85]|nr:putative phosphorylase [Wilcoxina mikolae CBS 423.85]
MSLSLDNNEILLHFDRLVATRHVFFTPSEAFQLVDQSFPFEFRICPSLLTKPQTPGEEAARDSSIPENSDPPVKFGPGSDIEKGDGELIITTILDTHYLVFNKFCIFRPQFLLLTVNSYRRQYELLDKEDFSAVWHFLDSSETPHFVIYNCTKEGGCSRVHKHMQIFSRHSQFELFSDAISQMPRVVPYRYFLHRFPNAAAADPITGGHILEIYLTLLEECKAALGIPKGAKVCPHNVVLVKEWMMVIPRRRSDVEGASANAAGMMGMVWVWRDEQMEKWKELGPSKVLSELGVPW